MTIHCLHLHAGNLFGGVERILTTLVAGENRVPGLRSSFGLAYEGRVRDELASLGATVTVLGGARLSRPWTVWSARRRAGQLLDRHRPNLVLCHSDWSQAIYGPPVRRRGVPLVRWLHAPPTGRHWLERWARRAPPDLTICNSRFTQQALEALENGPPSEIVHPPVPAPAPTPEDRQRVRAALGASNHTTVILQVGRMEAGKGHPVLLDALGRLRERRDWMAWQVGGAQRDREASYVGSLGLRTLSLGLVDRVRFLGERRDMAAIFSAADIYCQPNIAPESFGITFVEALYAGLPVVTTKLGGAAEIVDETCGLLLSKADAGALAVALGRLLDEPGLRGRLAAAGPARARRLCDPDQQVARLAACLTRVAK